MRQEALCQFSEFNQLLIQQGLEPVQDSFEECVFICVRTCV